MTPGSSEDTSRSWQWSAEAQSPRNAPEGSLIAASEAQLHPAWRCQACQPREAEDETSLALLILTKWDAESSLYGETSMELGQSLPWVLSSEWLCCLRHRVNWAFGLTGGFLGSQMALPLDKHTCRVHHHSEPNLPLPEPFYLSPLTQLDQRKTCSNTWSLRNLG